MKVHPISESFIFIKDNYAQIENPAGKDPQAENPHNGSNPFDEKRPNAPECEPHFFYYPSLRTR